MAAGQQTVRFISFFSFFVWNGFVVLGSEGVLSLFGQGLVVSAFCFDFFFRGRRWVCKWNGPYFPVSLAGRRACWAVAWRVGGLADLLAGLCAHMLGAWSKLEVRPKLKRRNHLFSL